MTMHPATHARTQPDRAAYIMGATGETVTYRELDDRSNQGAQLFRSLGLKTGDVIALMLDNHPRYFEIAWAAQRSGLYFTCISSKLSAGEIEYIMGDCEAKVLITSAGVGSVIDELPALIPGVKLYMVGRHARRAHRRPDRRRRHALFFGHHRPAQGHQAPPDRRPHR
jgi:long-chain acyl-CoA synthetase